MDYIRIVGRLLSLDSNIVQYLMFSFTWNSLVTIDYLNFRPFGIFQKSLLDILLKSISQFHHKFSPRRNLIQIPRILIVSLFIFKLQIRSLKTLDSFFSRLLFIQDIFSRSKPSTSLLIKLSSRSDPIHSHINQFPWSSFLHNNINILIHIIHHILETLRQRYSLRRRRMSTRMNYSIHIQIETIYVSLIDRISFQLLQCLRNSINKPSKKCRDSHFI